MRADTQVFQRAPRDCTPCQPLLSSLPPAARSPAAIAVSIDHKPNNNDERERIENAGGVVVWAGTWRVGGVLAVSRAFGDKPLKKYVISSPYVREEHLAHEDEFLILASDGVWDVLTNEVRERPLSRALAQWPCPRSPAPLAHPCSSAFEPSPFGPAL